ncbi:MAG: NAD(P)/FAD-dependent oxidoreductase [Holosporales bacterium]|nr:NAD(P)/FAD-dependent oxidoreductase [Holosporales bacterium]
MENNFKTVVIGAGPVGLFASSMLEMLGIHVAIFETRSEIGGQCLLYPEKPVYGIPAMPGIKSIDLVNSLYKQALDSGACFYLNTCVEKINKNEEDNRFFEITTSRGKFLAESIVITAGFGAFTHVPLGLPNESDFEGKSLFYSISDINKFAGKNVVIAGGGNAAIDWALELSKIAQSISIVHRREQFRCNESTFALLEKSIKKGITRIYTSSYFKELIGKNRQLEKIIIQTPNGEILLYVNNLLVFFGISTNIDYMQNWGIALENQRIPINETTGATNIPGIFAAGDIVSFPNKVNIIVTGFGEAAKTAYAVKFFLNPEVAMQNNCQALKG